MICSASLASNSCIVFGAFFLFVSATSSPVAAAWLLSFFSFVDYFSFFFSWLFDPLGAFYSFIGEESFFFNFDLDFPSAFYIFF